MGACGQAKRDTMGVSQVKPTRNMHMQKISPFLWFDTQAEEAARLYTSVFKNAKMGEVTRYPEGSRGGMVGQVMTVSFELEGMQFTALNGGPAFTFTEAISFVIDCEDQEEVDHYWNSLVADGGEESQCGWLKDKFGMSWQIVPRRLNELLADPDPVKAQRAMEAMLQMQKIDISAIEAAVNAE
jgi:predicted 3-demethylubiquinone-9 3-methyltransferase (glyoxalase superfamily)